MGGREGDGERGGLGGRERGGKHGGERNSDSNIKISNLQLNSSQQQCKNTCVPTIRKYNVFPY